MVTGTAALQSGRLDLESIVRAPLVVIADPVVAASGPPATLDELAASMMHSSPVAGSSPKPPVSMGRLNGGGVALLQRPAGTILAVANPAQDSGLFVWASSTFLAVVADPDGDTPLEPAGEFTISSGRLVVGAPDVIAVWGPDVDTGDGSPVRARMHRGRTRLGLIVVAHTPPGLGSLAIGGGAAAVSFPTMAAGPTPAGSRPPLISVSPAGTNSRPRALPPHPFTGPPAPGAAGCPTVGPTPTAAAFRR